MLVQHCTPNNTWARVTTRTTPATNNKVVIKRKCTKTDPAPVHVSASDPDRVPVTDGQEEKVTYQILKGEIFVLR